MTTYEPVRSALRRDVPKPVIAAMNGVAVGGGHVLHVPCDRSIAADELRDKAREYARKIASSSPTAVKFLKHSFNADTEHIAGPPTSRSTNVLFDGLNMFVHSDEGMEGARRSPRSDLPTSPPTADVRS